MSDNNHRLTQFQIATLRALAEACNFSVNAHPPEEAILRRFRRHLWGDARGALDQLRRIGLCQRHPTGGNTTWNITIAGLTMAQQV